MKTWIKQLNQQDKWRIIVATSIFTVVMIYFFAWAPFATRASALETSVRDDIELLQWMQTKVNEVKRLRSVSSTRTTRERAGQSLLGIADSSAREFELASFVKRIQPSHNQGGQVWLEDAPFDKVIVWLEALEEYGVVLHNVKIRRQKEAGLVNVELMIKDPV